MAKRTALQPNTELVLKNRENGEVRYFISRVLGRGGRSLVYDGYYLNNLGYKVPVRIKECYPEKLNLTRDENGCLLPGTGAEENFISCKNDFRRAFGISAQLFYRQDAEGEEIAEAPEAGGLAKSMDAGGSIKMTGESGQDKIPDASSLSKVADANGLDKTVDVSSLTNSIFGAVDLYEANNTLYVVTSYAEGVSLDKWPVNSLLDAVKIVESTAKCIQKIHEKNYLYLDIKPENIFVFPETKEMIRLFDFDSMVPVDDALNCRITYTDGFSPMEQKEGLRRQIGRHSDIYSLGALLFYLCFQRTVKADDCDLEEQDLENTSYYDFSWQKMTRHDGNLLHLEGSTCYDFSKLVFGGQYRDRLYLELTKFFGKTLQSYYKDRYQTAQEAAGQLAVIRKYADLSVPFVLPSAVSGGEAIIGRSGELKTLQEWYEDGTAVVFVYGMGGIGKSTLVRHFLHKNRQKIGTVVFLYFDRNLETTFADDRNFFINNCAKMEFETTEEYYKRKLNLVRQIPEFREILFVVDNYDGAVNETFRALVSLGCRFIFLTRMDERDSGYPAVEIKEFSKREEMQELFCARLGIRGPLTYSGDGVCQQTKSALSPSGFKGTPDLNEAGDRVWLIAHPNGFKGTPDLNEAGDRAWLTAHPSGFRGTPDGLRREDIWKMNEIIDKLAGHTLSVELVAGQIARSYLTFDEALELVTKNGFSGMAAEKVSYVKDGIRNYDKVGRLIRALYDVEALNGSQRRTLKLLSLFEMPGIPVREIKQTLSLESLDEVNELADLGWVTVADKKAYLHPLIAETIGQYRWDGESRAAVKTLMEDFCGKLQMGKRNLKTPDFSVVMRFGENNQNPQDGCQVYEETVDAVLKGRNRHRILQEAEYYHAVEELTDSLRVLNFLEFADLGGGRQKNPKDMKRRNSKSIERMEPSKFAEMLHLSKSMLDICGRDEELSSSDVYRRLLFATITKLPREEERYIVMRAGELLLDKGFKKPDEVIELYDYVLFLLLQKDDLEEAEDWLRQAERYAGKSRNAYVKGKYYEILGMYYDTLLGGEYDSPEEIRTQLWNGMITADQYSIDCMKKSRNDKADGLVAKYLLEIADLLIRGEVLSEETLSDIRGLIRESEEYLKKGAATLEPFTVYYLTLAWYYAICEPDVELAEKFLALEKCCNEMDGKTTLDEIDYYYVTGANMMLELCEFEKSKEWLEAGIGICENYEGSVPFARKKMELLKFMLDIFEMAGDEEGYQKHMERIGEEEEKIRKTGMDEAF